MRKLLLLSSLLLASFFAQAQNAVEALAAKVASSTVSFDYSYLIKMQFTVKGSGSVTVCGSSFRMEGDGLVICCDGATRWTADEEARELVLEAVDDEQSAFAVNPALMISALDSAFSLTDNGGGSYTLVPKANTGLKLLKLGFKGERLVTAAMTFPNGIVVDLTISGMKFTSPLPASSFCYTEVDSSWVVTDLR